MTTCIRVQYTAQLRTALGRLRDDIPIAEGATLAELLASIAAADDRRGAPFLLTPTGDVQPSLLLTVNGAAVSPREARTLVLRPNDEVVLLPPIAGG